MTRKRRRQRPRRAQWRARRRTENLSTGVLAAFAQASSNGSQSWPLSLRDAGRAVDVRADPAPQIDDPTGDGFVRLGERALILLVIHERFALSMQVEVEQHAEVVAREHIVRMALDC